MFKLTKKIVMICLLVSSAVVADEKVYLNDDDIKTTHDKFYLHEGGNVWLQTSSLHRDKQGLFTFESDLIRVKDGFNAAYQKTWRCPYCNQHWPVGQKCQNSSCPSKY